MKRMISLLFALVLVMLPMTMASAEEPTPVEDSTYVSEEIRDLLGAPEDATVTQMYNTQIFLVFGARDTIENVLAWPKMQVYYHIEMPDGTWMNKVIMDGEAFELEMNIQHPKAMEVYKSGCMLDLLGEDTVAENIYYLSGESSYTGTAIYYRTNKGDYVYCLWTDIGECFFPAEAFFATMNRILEESAKYGHMDGGVDLSNVLDLSAYQLDSPTFFLNPVEDDSAQLNSNWIWVVVIAVLAVVSLTVGFVVHKKRRAHT